MATKSKPSSMPRKIGRPTADIKPDEAEIVLLAISNGVPLVDAAPLAGISVDTLRRWVARGEEAVRQWRKNPYSEFLRAYKRAESEFIAHHLAKIRSDKSWQASAWLLERKFPDRFALSRAPATGDSGVKIVIVPYAKLVSPNRGSIRSKPRQVIDIPPVKRIDME